MTAASAPALRIVVVGGGISGLAAAWSISDAAPDADVLVLEAARSVGGKLQVAEIAGVAVDVGAEAMLARRPEGVELARAAGLAADVIAPRTTSAQLWAGGARHALPPRTFLGIPDGSASLPMLSARSRAVVSAERDTAPMPALREDVSVGALVRGRLGAEVLDRLVDPLLGGVYAGRAEALSLQATMPALYERLAAAPARLTEAVRAVVDRGVHDPTAGPVFASVAGGLGRLPQQLARSGRFTVRTGTTVRSITRTPAGFELVVGAVPASTTLQADAVVVATPAAKASRLLDALAPAAAAELAQIESASMAICSLAYRDVDPPPGSGILVAAREGFSVKAVTLSSQKWPMHTGAGVTILRASLGRAGEAHVLQRDDEELLALVRHELRGLLGIGAVPLDALVTRWGGALPQYAPGHVARVARIRASLAQVPGLAVCGAAFDGVGIPACIAAARRAGDQVLAAPLPRAQ
ncbi:MAG: protoporphyrinogen oxidase [Jatrophihabitantaceae bacterium]